MDELKRFLIPGMAGVYVFTAIFSVPVIALVVWLINLVKNRSDTATILVCGGLLFISINMVLMVVLKRRHTINQQLKQLQSSPDLQEEIIRDFRESEWFWDGQVRIGEKNIYKRGYGILPRNDRMQFRYREDHSSKVSSYWIIYLKTGYNTEIQISSKNTSYSNEFLVRNEVEKANRYLSDTAQ